MSPAQIKYIGIIRVIDDTLLCTEAKDPEYIVKFFDNPYPYNDLKADYNKKMRKITAKLGEINLLPQQHLVVESDIGLWFAVCDYRKIYYIILADSNFSEINALSLTSRIIEHLQTLDNYFTQDEETVRSHAETYLSRLLAEYNNLEPEKSQQTNDNIEKITFAVEVGVNNSKKNLKDLEALDEKTRAFRKDEKDFEDNTYSLKVASLKKKKILISIVSLVLAISLVILLYLLVNR